MPPKKEIFELLYRSLDTELTAKEQDLLEKELQSSSELKDELADILKLRKLLADAGKEEFLPVAESVMQSLPARNSGHVKSISDQIWMLFPRVAAACLLIIFGLLVYTYTSSGSLTSDSVFGVSSLTLDDTPSLVENQSFY